MLDKKALLKQLRKAGFAPVAQKQGEGKPKKKRADPFKTAKFVVPQIAAEVASKHGGPLTRDWPADENGSDQIVRIREIKERS